MPPQRFEALITELLLQMGFDESTVKVPGVIKEWEGFASAVTHFYALAGISQKSQTGSQQAIQQTIGQQLPTQLSRLVNWTNLRAGLLEWHDQIVQRIVEAG